MNLFELFVKIGVDDQASGKLKDLGGKLGNGLKTAAKIGTAAVGAAAAGITALTTAAVNNYAEYEQLVGGVETLFKDSADVVKNYANEAYKSAGLSANEYMSTVTSFSASLLQSLGRGAQTDLDALKENLDEQYDATKKSWQDRIAIAKKLKQNNVAELEAQMDAELKALKKGNEQKLAEAETANNKSVTTAETQALAADLANQAVIDMADNAAKMGTSMEMIQNAYAGFAKQNYTMLDNLKLGYGGTQSEMQRLIKDAAALDSSIDANSMSFANIVKAINVVQTEMDITGTTAKEAASTIQGSVGMMKSSWTNLVTGIADENANLDVLIANFVDSVGTVATNLIPKIGTALNGVSRLVQEIVPKIIKGIPKLLKNNLPVLVKAAVSIFESLIDSIDENKDELFEMIFELTEYIAESFIKMLPEIIKLGLQLVVSLAKGISNSLPKLLPTIISVILEIVDILTDKETLSNLLNAAIEIIKALADALLKDETLDKLIDACVDIMITICEVLVENVDKLFDVAVKIITALMDYLFDPENSLKINKAGADILDALGNALENAITSLSESIAEIIDFIVEKFTGMNLSEAGKKAIKSFVDGLLSGIAGSTTTVGISSAIVDYIKSDLDGSHRSGLDYVPYDGYIAELHKGERVLTASEARESWKTRSFGDIIINIDGAKYSDEQNLAQAVAEALQNMTDRRAAVYA